MAPIDFSRIRRTLLVAAFAVGAAVCAQSAEEAEESRLRGAVQSRVTVSAERQSNCSAQLLWFHHG